jgi:hypothetical protein
MKSLDGYESIKQDQNRHQELRATNGMKSTSGSKKVRKNVRNKSNAGRMLRCIIERHISPNRQSAETF